MHAITFKETLIKVRELIANDKERFICLAITEVLGAYHDLNYRQRIIKQIDFHYTYDDWVDKNFPELQIYKLSRETFNERAKQGRLNWIDYMISQEQ